MNVPPTGAPEHTSDGLSRRTALKTGAIGGAVVWAVPAVQILGISAAHADDPSPVSPPPPPPPPPPPTGTLPSHGFVLVDCGEGVFAVKIEGNPATLGALGAGNDVPFLATKGLVLGVDYRQATPDDLTHLAGFGIGSFDPDGAGPVGPTIAYWITLGAGCTFHDGYSYVFDGSFAGGGENCGDEDKFTKAFVEGPTVYFTTICNEPVTGE